MVGSTEGADLGDLGSDGGYSSPGGGGGYSSPGYSTDEGRQAPNPPREGSSVAAPPTGAGACTVGSLCCRMPLHRYVLLLAFLGVLLMIWAAVDGFAVGVALGFFCLCLSGALYRLHYGSWQPATGAAATATATPTTPQGAETTAPTAPGTGATAGGKGGKCAAAYHAQCAARHAAVGSGSGGRCAIDALLTFLSAWCLLLVMVRGACSWDFAGTTTFPTSCYPNFGGRVPRSCVRLAPGAKAVDAHNVPAAPGTGGALAALPTDAGTARALVRQFLTALPVARVVREGGVGDAEMLHVTTLTAGWGFVDDACAAFHCDALTGKTLVSAQLEQRMGSADGGLGERRMRSLQDFLVAQMALLPVKNCSSA